MNNIVYISILKYIADNILWRELMEVTLFILNIHFYYFRPDSL